MLQSQAPDGALLWLDERQFEEGLSLLDAIAQYSETIPVLVLTGIQDFHQRLQLVQQGADDFIPKSAIARELPNRILNRLHRQT